MELEWDEEKRQWTLEQRGLDFRDLARFDWSASDVVTHELTRTEMTIFRLRPHPTYSFAHSLNPPACALLELVGEPSN